MSRHRDVRSMNYSDEYDGYDDVYGHSVEDDYCVSPGAEQFMFDRNKQANIASFFTEPDIVEDDEDVEDVPSSYKLPQLSELDTAKLMSCVEAIKNVVGETYPESELNKKIIEFNYNTEAVLNFLLNNEALKKEKDKQPEEKDLDTQSDFKFQNLISGNRQTISNQRDTHFGKKYNFTETSDKNDKSQQFSSLSDMISHSLKPLQADFTETSDKNDKSQEFSSLSDMISHSLKPVQAGFTETSGKNDKPQEFSSLSDMISHSLKPLQVNSSSNNSFNSLNELSSHHLKMSEKKPNLLSGFAIPNLNFKSSTSSATSSSTPFFNSLADLTAHHLKISTDDSTDSAIKVNLPSGFIIPKMDSKKSNLVDLPSFNLPDLSPKVDTNHEIKKSENLSNLIIPNLSIKIKQEQMYEDEILPEVPKSILKDMSNLKVEEKFDPNKVMNLKVEEKFDPYKVIKTENNIHSHNQPNKSLEATIQAIKRECISIYQDSLKLSPKPASSFGKVLCKKYKRKTPNRRKTAEEIKTVLQFDFSSPSPDSIILARLNLKTT